MLDKARATTKQRTCRSVIHRDGFGRYRTKKCITSLRYRLESKAFNKAREAIEKIVFKDVHYDVHVGLIALPDGGYNLQLTNRRNRREIRGLVDPSFVAFAVGGHTARTDWKSRHLTIWLNGLREGWTLPTSGGRKALRRGKSASRLGFFGVVDVSTYRKWLEAAFQPMLPVDPISTVVVQPESATQTPPLMKTDGAER